MASNAGLVKPTSSVDFAKKDMKHGFLSGNKAEEKRDGASGSLRSAEDNAVSRSPEKSVDDLAGARENEEKAGGLYTGGGRSGDKDRGRFSDKFKGKGKGFLKKKGPAGLIIGLIFGVGGLVGGAQLLQPFSLVEQFKETFNSMHTSVNMRSNVLVRYQMDNNLVKDPIKNRNSIFSKQKFKISDKQKINLAKNGVEVDNDFEGSGVTVLKYKDEASGKIIIAYPDISAETKVLAAASGKSMTYDGVKYKDVIIGTFDDVYKNEPEFFSSYNKGSLTWRGNIANWFGSVTEKFFGVNLMTRNLFKNFKNDTDSDDGSVKTEVTDLIAKGTEEIKEGGVEISKDNLDEENQVIINEDGKVSTTKTNSGSGKYTRADVKSNAEVKAKLEEIAAKYKGDSGSGISGAAQQVSNYACLLFNFIGGINLLVAANEAIQIIHLVTAFFEAVDKVKAGNGSESPINDLTNALNERKSNTYEELKRKDGVNVNTEDILANFSDNGNDSTLNTAETITVSGGTKSAMESAGIVSIYSGTKIDTDDPSVKSFNVTSNLNTLLGSIGTSMVSFEACAIAKMAANAAGVVESAIEISSCIAGALGAAFTFGASLAGCVPALTAIAAGMAVSAGVAVIISGVISFLTPTISTALTRDLISDIGGEDFGNALTSGANMYLGNTHKANGGSLSNFSTYVAFNVERERVIADDARYERMIKSPFDITSKNTFFGSLLNKLATLSMTNSFFGLMREAGSVISSSLVSLTPYASAYDISNNLMPEDEYEEICPYLASIGAVGDAFCNPYMVSDISTIDDDPSEVVGKIDTEFLDDLDAQGNVQVKPDSDLAKYIIFCDNRTSAFGIADQNITNAVSNFGQVETGTVLDSFINPAIGAIPIVGDGIDVFQNAQALANAGYISGESCVAGNSVSGFSASPNWDRAKYYQRFIEDQSLMESMGIIKESAVTAFLNDYYEKNPLDNSYEGVLARYSGIEKADIVSILDLVEWGNYIANYNPAERYAFGTPEVEKSHEILFDDNNVVAEGVHGVLLNEISFADVRNRSFAV